MFTKSCRQGSAYRTLTFLLILSASISAQAASISVGCSTTSLIDAINQANGTVEADTLQLSDACRYTFNAADNISNGANALPVITSQITLSGNRSILDRDPAGERLRFFRVAESGNLSLENITLQNGHGSDGVIGSLPDQSFAALGQAPNGGAIFTDGALQLFRVNILNNRAGDGAAQVNSSGGSGGAIATDNNGTLQVSDSYIAGNTTGSSLAASGGRVGTGGAISLRGTTFSIDRSTLVDNTIGATPPNAGFIIAANIIAAFADTFVARRSTFSGNGDDNDKPGIFFNSASVTIEFSNNTFVNNENRAIRIASATPGGVIIRNNLFEANESACSIDSEDLNVTASSNNLFDSVTDTCSMTNGVNGNLTGLTANVGPLQDNGGFTPTHDLPPNSAARDRYNINDSTFKFDQRGTVEYGIDGDSGRFSVAVNADIGAIEAINVVQIEDNTSTTANSLADFGRAQDWYSVDLEEGDEINVTLQFLDSIGDVDLKLYRKNDLNNALAASESVSDTESILFNAPESASYWFVVYGFSSAENDYDLEITLNRNSSCFPIPTKNGKLAVVCL